MLTRRMRNEFDTVLRELKRVHEDNADLRRRINLLTILVTGREWTHKDSE